MGSTPANNVTIGKNKSLSSEKPKWKSEIPITMGQLRSKRDEYWETQPAFEGRKEIWDALRAAAETDDMALAQAFVDGANITLPSGQLSDAYDELGNHYTVPLYCISLPTNIITCEDASSPNDAAARDNILKEPSGEELLIKIRLSTSNKDTKMTVRTGETIGAIKHRIHNDFGVAPNKQRCFFAGKLLYDKLTIGETKISRGYVVQIVVAPDS